MSMTRQPLYRKCLPILGKYANWSVGIRGLAARSHFFQLNSTSQRFLNPPKTVLPARDQVFKPMFPFWEHFTFG